MSEVIGFRKRRGVELIMLTLAMAIGSGGYVLTELNQHAKLPDNWPWALGAYFGLGLLAHLMIGIRIPYADPLILPMVMLLNGLGLSMIHRLDLASSPVMHSAELQLMWTAIAIACFAVVVIFLNDHRRLQRFTYTLFLVGMGVLMLPMIPGLGVEKHGANIWIKVGSYNFQPAEVAKIVLSIAFASYLVEKRDVLALAGGRVLGIDLPRPRDLGPILIMWAASMAVLIWQKDLGTSLLFFGLFVMMLYVATERPSWAILGTLLFAGGAFLGYLFFSHVKVRVSAWLDPFSNYDQNLQVISAQFGLAWGGLFGTGWGLGRPNLTPLAKNDFIAAAIGEELGVVGLSAVVMVYVIIIARGLRCSLTAREPFGKLLAAGLSFVFAIQVFTIIAGVTRLAPLTGLTTPFMSQGGSSLVANWVMLALLMVITHQVRRPAVDSPAGEVESLASESTQVMASHTPLSPSDLRAAPPVYGPATPVEGPASPSEAEAEAATQEVDAWPIFADDASTPTQEVPAPATPPPTAPPPAPAAAFAPDDEDSEPTQTYIPPFVQAEAAAADDDTNPKGGVR